MADGSHKRNPESDPLLEPTGILHDRTDQNQAMRDLTELLKSGEDWFKRCKYTTGRPKEGLLRMLLSTLDNIPDIRDRCTHLLEGKPPRRDISFDVNTQLKLDPPSDGRKMIENAANLLSGQFQHTTEKSAGPLRDMIKVDEQLQASGGRCVRTRIQKVLAAHSSCDLPTPAKSKQDDSASANCATTRLQEAWEIAQGLCTSDLEELNQQCTKLLETRNGTTPMQLEGEAAAGAASGKKSSQKTVHFAETPQSGTEEDDKVKAWHEGAWHSDVRDMIADLKNKKIVDVETLDRSAVNALKWLPYKVAIVALTKRMNETGTIKNESLFFVKNCKYLRSQWDIDSECSADDESDDEEDSNDEGAAQHDAESSDHCASQSEDDMSEQGNADIDI